MLYLFYTYYIVSISLCLYKYNEIREQEYINPIINEIKNLAYYSIDFK